MRRLTATVFVVAFTTSLAACGGNKSSKQSTESGNASSQISPGMNQLDKMSQNMAAAANRTPVAPVSFKVLIDYLPKSVPGMKEEEPRGETSSAGQWQYSQAEAHYRGTSGNQSAKVSVADYANIPTLYAPIQMVMSMNLNQESTEGYERNEQIGGFPAHERWRKDGQSDEVMILVGNRFVVTTTTHGVGEGSAQKVAESIDLKGLAGKAPS